MQRDEASVFDIVEACRRVLDFRGSQDLAAFAADVKTQSAVLYQIVIIGEAAKRLSAVFRNAHPSIAWRDVAGMRDRVVHGYDVVDLKRVWRVVDVEVPALLTYLVPLIRKP